MTVATPVSRKLMLTVAEAAKLGGPGRTRIFELIRERKIKAYKEGRKTLMFYSDYEEYLRMLPLAGKQPGP